jgi:hypothetical protein
LIIHIDNLRSREEVNLAKEVHDTLTGQIPTSGALIHPSCTHQIQCAEDSYIESDLELDSTTETNLHNEVIDNCEAFLAQSQEEKKAVGRFTRQASRKVNRKADRIIQRKAKKPIRTFGTQTEGIDGSQ